jgi:hypothetical protein
MQCYNILLKILSCNLKLSSECGVFLKSSVCFGSVSGCICVYDLITLDDLVIWIWYYDFGVYNMDDLIISNNLSRCRTNPFCPDAEAELRHRSDDMKHFSGSNTVSCFFINLKL